MPVGLYADVHVPGPVVLQLRGRNVDILAATEEGTNNLPDHDPITPPALPMGATHDDFIKYPRTPHLFGSKGTDDDKHLGRAGSEAFIAEPSLIVEEKLDGTNVGIHFTRSGRM